jgi:hypothetical protein
MTWNGSIMGVASCRTLAVWAAVAAAAVSASAATETYAEANIDANGQLRIVTAAGHVIRPGPLPARPNVGDQVGYDQVAISPDRRLVGWLALYPNCCTSYPIPLALVVYSNGKTRRFTGNDLPVWRWRFEAAGRQVAFEQETVHGATGVHYELRDVSTGRLIDQYNPTSPRNPTPDRVADVKDVPSWVTRLDQSR